MHIIFRRVAEHLGWKLWDKEITAAIARRLNCEASQVERHEERIDSVFYRMMKTFMRGSFEPRTETANFELLDAENLAGLFEKVIREVAEKGDCVIVGRAAPWFLRDRTDVFSIFLYAPYEEKLRRTIAGGESRGSAEHLLDTVDQERAAFIRKYYGKDWPDRYLYDLMINTKSGDDAAIAAILQQLRS